MRAKKGCHLAQFIKLEDSVGRDKDEKETHGKAKDQTARKSVTSRSLSNLRNWWGVTKMRRVAPSTAVMMSGSATTLSVNLWPFRYLRGGEKTRKSHERVEDDCTGGQLQGHCWVASGVCGGG
jgi:hypothetical protein